MRINFNYYFHPIYILFIYVKRNRTSDYYFFILSINIHIRLLPNLVSQLIVYTSFHI